MAFRCFFECCSYPASYRLVPPRRGAKRAASRSVAVAVACAPYAPTCRATLSLDRTWAPGASHCARLQAPVYGTPEFQAGAMRCSAPDRAAGRRQSATSEEPKYLMYLDLLGSFGSRARVFCNLAPRRPSRDVPRFEPALKKSNRLKWNELLGSSGFRARMFCALALQRAIPVPG